MSSSFSQPLIDLLRVALQALEGEPFPLGAEETKRIHYLRELITINDPDSGDPEMHSQVVSAVPANRK